MAELKLEISDLPSAVEINPSDLLHIKQGVIDKKITYSNMLLPHTTDYENPHQVTKAQVGLGNVTNDQQLKIASNLSDIDSNAIARSNIDVYSKSESDANLYAHSSNVSNPHFVTKEQVGLSQVKNYPISNSYTLDDPYSFASSKALNDGVLNAKSYAVTKVNNHANNKNNPHAVTKAQVGLGDVQDYGISDSYTLNSSTSYASSKALRDGLNSIDSQIYAAIFVRGMIILWSGDSFNVPQGFALCNGSNGTPNLTDRFVVGSGSEYNTGDRGGTDTNSHNHSATVGSTTLTLSQIPSHSHNASHNHSASFNGNTLGNHYHDASHNHSASFSGNNLPTHAHNASHNHSGSFKGNQLPKHGHNVTNVYSNVNGGKLESGDGYNIYQRVQTRPTTTNTAGTPTGSVTINTKTFNTSGSSAGKPSGSVSVSTKSFNTGSSSAGRPSGSVTVNTASFNTSSTGGGGSHNHGATVATKNLDNRPPYYALAYIMKL